MTCIAFAPLVQFLFEVAANTTEPEKTEVCCTLAGGGGQDVLHPIALPEGWSLWHAKQDGHCFFHCVRMFLGYIDSTGKTIRSGSSVAELRDLVALPGEQWADAATLTELGSLMSITFPLHSVDLSQNLNTWVPDAHPELGALDATCPVCNLVWYHRAQEGIHFDLLMPISDDLRTINWATLRQRAKAQGISIDRNTRRIDLEHRIRLQLSSPTSPPDVIVAPQILGTAVTCPASALSSAPQQDSYEARTSLLEPHQGPTLRWLQWNARSLPARLEEVRRHAKQYNFQFLALQETFLDSGLPNIDNFTCMAYAGRKSSRGGGVAVYCSHSASYHHIRSEANEIVEYCCFSICGSRTTRPCKVLNVYIKPEASMSASEEEVCNTFMGLLSDLQPDLVVGDLNASMPGFDIWTPENKRGSLLADALGADQVPHAFHFPTRREGISMSAPDAILTNLAASARVSTTPLLQGGSDHVPISACLQGRGDWPQVRRVPRWSLAKADWPSFEQALLAGVAGLPTRDAGVQKRYAALVHLLQSTL
eukprot:1724294-Amphidinium_carterae.1